MSTAAVIAILVAAGEGRTPATQALVAAAEEALGAGIAIRVFEASPPSDDAALDVETEVEAYAAVTLVWQDDARLKARTRVHVARTDRWTDRELAFAKVDTLAERGRALGFAVASMLPDEARARPAAVQASRPPPPPPPSGPALGRSVGLFAVGATQKGGGAGASLDAAVSVADALALRAAVAARWGAVTGANDLEASSLVTSVAAGLGWWFLEPIEGRPVGLGLRADALLLHYQVYRGSDSASRFKPGADLVAELALRLAAGLELGVGIGVEATFGKSEVFVGDDEAPAATIGWLRAIGEAGVRMRF